MLYDISREYRVLTKYTILDRPVSSISNVVINYIFVCNSNANENDIAIV